MRISDTFKRISMPSISDIAAFIGFKLVNDTEITGFKSLKDAGIGDMTFCSSARYAQEVATSKASLIICPSELKGKVTTEKTVLIFVDNSKLWFVRCMKHFGNYKQEGIHPSALVETKKIGRNVSIGAHTFIASHVTIGDNVRIGASASIGHDGFGYVKNERGEWEDFPHIGGVVIGNNVDIGDNTCIDRGSLEDTFVDNGTKIDNLVHIAHNVKIGKNCMIVAQSLLGGSCILEDDVFIGAGVVVRDGGIVIGKNSFVGMGAVVTKNIPANTTVAGVPARPLMRDHA